MPNTNQIKSAEFISLVACIMLLTALAIDIMLPTFDAIRDHFGLGRESTATAQIVTFFFLGQMGQLIFGPLSDRFGRLPVLRTGFVLYIGGCIATAALPSLEGILAARFVVGMGAAAMLVSAVATVRDRFVGNTMARTMSLILTIFLTVPIVAPLLGSFILNVSNWRIVFLSPAIVAAAIFAWSFRLSESLPPAHQQPLDVLSLLRSAKHLARTRNFVRYTAITTILFAAFSSYIASSERMITEIYGQPTLFVGIFAGVGAIMPLFTFLNAQLVTRFGARRTVKWLLAVYLILASLLLSLTLTGQGPPNIFIFFAFIAVLQGINVAAEPNSSALALEPVGSIAGMAAAIYGTSYLVVGALMGSLIDRLLVDSVTPLSVAYFIEGSLVLILVYRDRTSAATVNVPLGQCGHLKE
jgi:DHA1 family bicyclomycin/chloramphenicol resistance-like MFS transporter